ncbi:MAG TPA: PAS domain-containing protein, partial [Roseiflexaceae bacterium]|nr:PAS domain-containing protein [Roseiflexaceae bacterium]
MTSTSSKSAPHPRTTIGNQQRLAQRYLVLADSMPQLVWATDAAGSHFYFNERWYEYTGLTEEQSMGFGFTNALHPDDISRSLARWQLACETGEPYEIEYRFRRHDGVYHWFIGRAMPVYDEQGTIVEWVGTCTDIDEQKRSSEMLQFQAEASTVLSETPDYQEALRKLVHMAVPSL